ncbi:MAG: DUF1553 domain-containing protein [Gemmataceae bacterium]|nr:DUF1553 domain-containing protein [Gemmataceae bacterium]
MKPLSKICLTVVVAGFWATTAHAQSKIEYNRDIRPILTSNCFACHGPDSAARKAELRLDNREDALAAEVIVPGKPEKSPLVQRIFSDKPAKVMPPPKSHKKLKDAEKELLRRWIASGAEYQPHWSLIAPKRAALPKVKNEKWVRNPIDAFILVELEKAGLTPAAEADRRTLARRLSLDLTGLPPDPADVEAFVNDQAPDAYEKYVDKMMASKHWGEHRGRYWLDAARYADSHGIHFDNYREIWAFRDWVINAFNKNMPFDQFTIEQLAGDLLPKRTLDQQIATGFNRCNITTNEGGVIPEEYLVLYTRDRTETVSQVWLAMTTGCAVCHNHKYDAFSINDFYSMSAFFNNTTQGAMDGNIPNTPPIITVPRAEDRPRWEALVKEIEEAKKSIAKRKEEAKKDYAPWLAQAKPETVAPLLPSEGLLVHAKLNEGKDKKVAVTVNGKPREFDIGSGFEWIAGKLEGQAALVRPGPSVEIADAGNFEKDQGFSVGGWVKIPRRGQTGAIVARMDGPDKKHRGWDLWMETDKIGMHIINAWPDDALKVTSKTPLQPNQWYHVLVTYDGSGKAAGVKVYFNGALQALDVFTDKLQNTIRTDVPLKIGQRHAGERLQGVALQDILLFGRTLSGLEADRLAKTPRVQQLLAKSEDKRTPQEQAEIFDWWLSSLDQPSRELSGKLSKLQQEEVTLKSRGTVAHVMQENNTEPIAYILNRGEYDQRRDKVKAQTPKALPPMAKDLPRNRLGFAQWLLQPDHPLTARVTVNRMWQEVFGTGLVRTAGDFGVAGELPSHPELLDWMALEFRETGWDVKKFFKMIVTSATYRQAATVTPEKLSKDPHNRLLSRAARYRLDAEMIRDYALASSGLLVRKLGGPSVKPYMPPGVWEAVAMIGSNTRDYKEDTGEKLYRRSMYTFWKRAAPPASMDILNAPNRETCTVRREMTNTPLQALVTLNDVQFVEAARHLAQNALKNAAETDGRIDFIAKRLLARSFRAEELKVVQESLRDLLAYYQANPKDAQKLITVGESRPDASLAAPELAAWTMLSNQLMNLDEVLNK